MKNNPCLVGEPGVGKTSIIQGLAQRILSGSVPEKLKGKKVSATSTINLFVTSASFMIGMRRKIMQHIHFHLFYFSGGCIGCG